MTNVDSHQLEVINFTVSFDRDAHTENVIDVDDLALALLGLSNAFRETSSLLNGDATAVRLNARAVSPGSVEVDLQLVQVISANAIHVLSSSLVVSALNLRNILIAADGVIGTVKRLAGSRPAISTHADGGAEIRANGDTFYIDADTVQVFENSNVRQSIRQFVNPLDGEIERITLRENDEDIIWIDKDEVQHFDIDDDAPGDAQYEVTTSITRESLSLVVPRFRPDPLFNKWRLRDGENSPSTYLITDEEFLKKVDRGTKFGKGDVLICEVRVTETSDGTVTRPEYEILKVHQHRDGLVQLPLLNGDQLSGGILEEPELGNSS